MKNILLRVEMSGLPPTVNQMYRTGRYGNRYKRPEVVEWQTETARVIREAWNCPLPYVGEVEVRVKFRVKGNRRWDIDNRLKALFDSLQRGGAIKDDSQISGIIAERLPGEESATVIEMMKYTGYREESEKE